MTLNLTIEGQAASLRVAPESQSSGGERRGSGAPLTRPPSLDVERRKSPVCGFVTPLQGPEADAHRKPEVGETKGTAARRLLPEPGPSLGSLPARGGRGGQKGTA